MLLELHPERVAHADGVPCSCLPQRLGLSSCHASVLGLSHLREVPHASF